MTRAINLKQLRSLSRKQFQKFVFIGNTAADSQVDLTEQLNLYPNSSLLSQANVESLSLAEIHTAENISHQLRSLKIKRGTIVKLVSKTKNGSVMISLDDRLIGIGAKIASKIITIPTDQTRL